MSQKGYRVNARTDALTGAPAIPVAPSVPGGPG